MFFLCHDFQKYQITLSRSHFHLRLLLQMGKLTSRRISFSNLIWRSDDFPSPHSFVVTYLDEHKIQNCFSLAAFNVTQQSTALADVTHVHPYRKVPLGSVCPSRTFALENTDCRMSLDSLTGEPAYAPH